MTMESQNDVIDDGRIPIVDGMIQEIWSSSEPDPESAEGGYQFLLVVPFTRFIDPHNHAKYNLIPLWDHGTEGWDNRYQWQSYSGYSDAKDIGCSIEDSSAMRFAELRAIAGGYRLQGSANEIRTHLRQCLRET